MPYQSLYKERWSALLLILSLLSVYCLVRGVAFLSQIGYDAYANEFDIIGRNILGVHWVLTGLFLIYAIFSTKFLPWRLALISASGGFGIWALLFLFGRGWRVFDAILIYGFVSLMFLALALIARDPRPVKRLKEVAGRVNDSIGV